MSLDVYLCEDASSYPIAADFLQENGFDQAAAALRNYTPESLFSANITHNLNTMAEAAGIYLELWRPEEAGIHYAHQLIKPLREGLWRLQDNPTKYKKFNPSNGWGDYEGLVEFVAKYLEACQKYPDAVVEACR